MDVALMPVGPTGARALPPVCVLGSEPLRSELAGALRQAGVDAQVADAPSPERGAVICALEGADGVVRAAFQAARAARVDAGGAFVVVTRLGGDFGLAGVDDPTLAGLYGLTKTLALEEPEAFVRAIDVDASVTAADLAAELGRAGPVEVSLSSAGRQTLRSVTIPSPNGAPVLGPKDVLVVSGGARGVTAACVIELATRTQAHFILLGRSRIDAEEPEAARAASDEPKLMRALAPTAGSPAELRKQVASILAAREARATLAAIAATGGHARYVPVDVANAEAVAAALAPLRAEWGPITGLVHGAGVIHDRKIKDKTDAQWDAVWSTKIDGARALLSATAQDPLRVVCFFSSVAARTGNYGQADYAAANEVLNRLAAREQRNRPDATVKSLGWGPWEGGMVTPSLAKAFHARGIALIPLLAGAQAFVDELASNGGRGPTEVVIGGLLAGDASAPSLRRASSRDYPFLRDHSVAASPVIPVVLALEWFAQRARELRPTAYVQAVENVTVLKGITLQQFEQGGDPFEVHTLSESPDGFSLELRTPGGPLHYRAHVRMGASPPVAPGVPRLAELGPYAHDAQVIYDRLLFHGPDFQVIRRVLGVSEEAAEAELVGVRETNWRSEDWLTDMAAGDGGLQLAVLWSRKRLGGASLPTGIASLRPYGKPAAGPVRGVLRGHRSEGRKTLSDVALVDSAGRVYAELLGVELHALPAGEYPGKAGEA